MTDVDNAIERAENDPPAESWRAPMAQVVGDRAVLAAEVKKLRRWKKEAIPVMDNLQELGKELDLPLGESCTGPNALAAVKRLQEENRRDRTTLLRQIIGRMDRGAVDCAAIWWLSDVADAVEEGREW